MAPEPCVLGASSSSSSNSLASTSCSRSASSTAASVALVSVLRASDMTILAERFDKSLPAEERRSIEAAMGQLLDRCGASPVYPRWKGSVPVESASSLIGGGGAIHALADQRGLCVIVSAFRGRYPERLAQGLLQELAAKVGEAESDQRICEAKKGELNGSLKGLLREAMASYSDPAKLDKVTDLHDKVDQVKGIMHDNVRKILETHASLETLQTKSDDMNTSASQFLKQSTDLKRQVQCRNLKVKVVVGLCAGGLGAYAVSSLVN